MTMALTQPERDKLDRIAEDAAAARALLEQHAEALREIFRRQREVETTLAQVSTMQAECPARTAVASKTGRVANWLAFGMLLVTFVGTLAALVMHFR